MLMIMIVLLSPGDVSWTRQLQQMNTSSRDPHRKISLDHLIQLLENRVDQLLVKPIYASTLQQILPPSLQHRLSKINPLQHNHTNTPYPANSSAVIDLRLRSGQLRSIRLRGPDQYRRYCRTVRELPQSGDQENAALSSLHPEIQGRIGNSAARPPGIPYGGLRVSTEAARLLPFHYFHRGISPLPWTYLTESGRINARRKFKETLLLQASACSVGPVGDRIYGKRVSPCYHVWH
ncbi:unnamed protein product [Tuber aestivum]|uniref:Uncharacterized protein n=1 Tax=Tuber aestivum TaxID=59557 RepID=A0A292Q7D5_9PEZI|nr:unnamed protein product [Tuber aestivum]